MERVPMILSETANLSAVSEPLKRSSRIKYTCFNVSQNYLVFGASSGGLYIFQREPCSFIQLLPSNIGSLTHVSISPCESFVAFSSVKGFISIIGYQSTSAPRFRRTSTEHEGSLITALQWSARSSELYVGDNSGRISVLGLLFYMGQSMFQLSHASLMQLDSRIVQMDWHYHLLLVSTLSRSYLCDTVHEQFRQIGSQLRDGSYGACFYNISDEDYAVSDYDRDTTRYSTPFSSLREGERLLSDDRLRNVKIYCARPGVRLWEVRIDGTVLNTLQLKRALAVPPTPVISLNDSPGNSNALKNATLHEPFNFSKLCRAVENQYLLAFHSSGLYLLDPGVNDAVIWSDSITGITDVQTVGDTLYLWCDDTKLRAVTVCKLDAFVVRLYLQNMFEVCARLVADHRNHIAAMIKESPKWQCLPELAKRIQEHGLAVPEEVSSVLNSLAHQVLLNQEKQTALKLHSGIFLVGNDFSLHYSTPAQTYSYRDALLKKQTDSNRLNGHAKDFSVRIECETRASSRESSDVESSTDDLDDVFQLLGITKQEMKIALKEMGNTITGTLTSSTKSVRQSLRVMMRKQKLPWAVNDWNTTPVSKEEDHLNTTSNGRPKSIEQWMETPNTRINNFIRSCENVSNYKSGGKGHEDYVFDLLESLVLFCYQYGALSFDEVNNIIMGRRPEPHCEDIKILEVFSEWLKQEENKIFLFSQIFSEDIITQIRIHVHNSIKSGTLVTWIRQNLPKISENASLYPSFMRNLYNEDEFLVDRIFSHFLNVIASLLDPFIILQCLSVCKSPCIFLSWNRVLELCQEGKLHRERSTLGLSKDDWPLPITLTAILIMLDLKQVEYCKSAPIRDIFYTILRLETRGLKNGKSESSVFEECGTLFMDYLAALAPPKISECLDDIEMRTYLLLHFEHMKCFQSDCKCCPCGFPLPFASDELVRHKLPHTKVCRSLVLWLNQNDKEKLDGLCQTNPLLWTLVLSARRDDPLETLLPTILQIGDFLELEHRSEEMSEELWSKVFHLCYVLNKNKCLGCSRPLPVPKKPRDESDEHHQLWKRFLEFLLRKTGPADATRLLSKHADLVPHGAIDKSFLQMCSLSTLIDPTSGLLSRFALDSISNDPRKIPNVSVFSHKLVEQLENNGFSTEMLPSSTVKPTSKHHWGLRINLDKATCPCCLLPLGSAVLVEKGGVAVFKCAHVFHTVCLQKRASLLKNSGCPVCPKKVL